jgi:hypothetical protein
MGEHALAGAGDIATLGVIALVAVCLGALAVLSIA